MQQIDEGFLHVIVCEDCKVLVPTKAFQWGRSPQVQMDFVTQGCGTRTIVASMDGMTLSFCPSTGLTVSTVITTLQCNSANTTIGNQMPCGLRSDVSHLAMQFHDTQSG